MKDYHDFENALLRNGRPPTPALVSYTVTWIATGEPATARSIDARTARNTSSRSSSRTVEVTVPMVGTRPGDVIRPAGGDGPRPSATWDEEVTAERSRGRREGVGRFPRLDRGRRQASQATPRKNTDPTCPGTAGIRVR